MQPAHRKLNRRDMRTLGLASLGGALEFYDFIIFVFFTKIISHLFFPENMDGWITTTLTFGIFAAGYLVRPVGGIIMAHFGDRTGRKRVFTFSILLMALSTLGMALVPTYASIGILAPVLLVFLRMLQGAAIGGEVPGAWTFVAEHVPPRYIGLATGVLTSGLSMGILFGSLVTGFINFALPDDMVHSFGWRLAFALGGIFGLFAVWLRRWLDETPVFQEMKNTRTLTREIPLKIVITRHFSGVAISVLLTWCLSAAVMITTLLTPILLQSMPYMYPADIALAANCITCFFLILATPVAGYLCDRVGGGRFFAGAGILFSLITWIFYHYAGVSVGMLFMMSAFLGFFAGFIGAVAYVMVHAFPAAVRFSGLSFSYNVSYAVFGGLTPVMISLIQHFVPMAHIWYLAGIGGLASLIGLYLLAFGEKRHVPASIEEGPVDHLSSQPS